MLVATPYRDFDARDKSPPRIISEIRKKYASCSTPSVKAKLSAELLLKCGNERTWCPRKVSVRGGQLHVSATREEGGPTSLRLPLRHLSLQAGSLPNSLSLCRGQNIVLTLQTASEHDFDEWVKTIAIELIRQTPLDAIKYLDILTIAECWTRKANSNEKDWNFNYIKDEPTDNSCKSCHDNEIPQIITTISNKENEHNSKEIIRRKRSETVSFETETSEEKVVEDLLKKCQNSENYVPVKEKLFLFESLCKMGRKVRSTEDVSLKVDTGTKRARSMHDLTNLNKHIAVREICKYFENKSDEEDGGSVKKMSSIHRASKRLVNSDSQLDNVYTFRKVITT